jgi:hypothetical protein
MSQIIVLVTTPNSAYQRDDTIQRRKQKRISHGKNAGDWPKKGGFL